MRDLILKCWNSKSEDIAKAMYEGHGPHDKYIGEIVDII